MSKIDSALKARCRDLPEAVYSKCLRELGYQSTRSMARSGSFLEKSISEHICSDVGAIPLSEEEIKFHNSDFVKEDPREARGLKPIVTGQFSGPTEREQLTSLQRKILRFLKINHDVKLKSTYISHGLSYKRGNTIRKKLEGAGKIFSRVVETEKM